MSIEDHQNETDVVKLVKYQSLKFDESCKDSEIPLFIKYCQNITHKRFQGKG